jgi:glycerol-3-phosphate dehydrogenase (NAD(P)+)
MQIGVIGGGSWATALVKILTDNEQNKSIHWWLRSQDTVDHILQHKHNPNYISSVEVHTEIVKPTANINEVIQSSDVILFVIPAAFLEDALKNTNTDSFNNKIVVSAIKGLVPQTGQIVGEYFETKYNLSRRNIGVITGPCHAEEVAFEKLSYLTVASESETTASKIQLLLNNRYIKTNISDDIYGTEYSAVLKNVYAMACGICHGMGCGDNFQAVLISNAIREIKRFINVVHPIKRDINDSAYLGDLLVTAYSQFSRNRTFGSMLGKGYSTKAAQFEMNMIAEGYYAAKTIFELNKKYNVNMPILEFAHSIVYENANLREALEKLENNID